MINSDKILFIPSLRKGNGTGHLKRCLDWASDFKTINILILRDADDELFDFKNHPLCKEQNNIQWHEAPGTGWELIILDNRSSESLPLSLNNIPLIAIDDSGSIRKNASYLMDTLPSLTNQLMNTDGYRFLKRPYNKTVPESLKNILISFGGEDASNLAVKVLDALNTVDMSLFIRGSEIKIDLIVPGAFDNSLKATEVNISIHPYIPELSDKLCNYDLIVCQFGMTAFEALSCSRFIYLLNPGAYHDSLSSAADLPFHPDALSLDVNSLSALLLEQFKNNSGKLEILKEKHDLLWKNYSRKCDDMEQWLSTMCISPDVCPVCNSSQRKTLARFEQKSYFQCIKCGMKYLLQFRIKEDIYNKDYFFSDYKNQYGKTYIEDFPHIQEMGRKRLKQIGKLNTQKGKILDIGCAYGPFLKTASEFGYKAYGLEISEDAVQYIKDKYKEINAIQGDLNKKETRNLFQDEQFQIITLWYVIEHFSDLSIIIPYLGCLLKKGGVLAMATPYASGVSGRFNSEHFYSSSPEDHYTLWDRKSAVKSLRAAGFSKIRFVSTGHHPERFPQGIKKIVPRFLLLAVSRLMGWGDTFEIYAQKG
jgi:2-polyprenyl-3-methyl-5-hydroxy-6-metoxy-1,4-benzoquinol methylase